jgi:hypothetical protein
MVSFNTFYLSLLSVSWVSTVSAALTVEQVEALGWFRFNIHNHGLAAAYSAVHQPLVDAYISDYIEQFHRTLNPYLNFVCNGQNPAPPPSVDSELTQSLNGIPRIVQLIGYSNLSILRDFKLALLPTNPQSIGDQSIFGRIDDRYLTRVSDEFGIDPTIPQRPWLGTQTVYLAALISMNNTMHSLVRRFNFQSMGATLLQRQRLVRYQDMITRLYNGMVQYLRIHTMLPYYDTVQDIRNELTELADSPISRARSSQIQSIAEDLSHAILSMIAIYGLPARPEMPATGTGRNRTPYRPAVPAAPGTEVISDVFARRWEAGRLINLGLSSSSANTRIWILQLLRGLKQDLKPSVDCLGSGSGWIWPIPSLVDLAAYLLERIRPAPRRSGTD